MARQDEIIIETLEDGTIKVQTPGISQTNHMNADRLLKGMREMAGGDSTRDKVQKHHHHEHEHADDHEHGRDH